MPTSWCAPTTRCGSRATCRGRRPARRRWTTRPPGDQAQTMRPATSVILLTTLIGAGQGLFLALFTVQSYEVVGLLPPADHHAFDALGSAVALGLLAAGLVASFFHLGRPERAWRTAAQWRTSWL